MCAYQVEESTEVPPQSHGHGWDGLASVPWTV
jgi:hypothetical protein